MSEARNDQSDDLVTRAVAAIRQLPLPSGPSAAIISQTSAALREAVRQPKTNFLQRIYHMPWTTKTSALLGIAASVLVMYLALSNSMDNSRAFAAFAEALNNVYSATWKTTTVVKGPQSKTITSSGIGMFLAPSHERTEMTTDGVKGIQIFDGEQDKSITLVPASKIAVVINLKNLPPGMESPFGKTFQSLRELFSNAENGKTGKVERLGVETIDGRRAQGLRIELGSIEVKLWADPKTLLPIRVEMSSGATAGPEVRIVMTDFRIGVDLDESLFSLDVPVGYTVRQTMQIDLTKTPWTYLADALKMAAECNEGVFPDTLRGENGIDGVIQRGAKTMAEKYDKGSLDGLKLGTDIAMKLGGAFGVLYALPPDAVHYAGKDVKLNTPNRPILWVTQKKGGQCVVIYADLSIQEVPAEEAPKLPQSDDGPKR